MKLFDNLLDKMKLSSDDDEYEDDDMMDDDEVEEERVSRRMRKAATKEDTYDDGDEEEKVEKVRPRKNVSERQAKSSSNKIVNLRRVTSSIMEVCLFKPNNYDTDSREIADTLLEGKSVLLNFEGIEIAVAQRIVDFISGVTHAIDGKLQKISRYIFIVTPRNVDLSGDFTESDLNDFAFSQGLDF